MPDSQLSSSVKRRIVDWATKRDDIRLIVLVGSRAGSKNTGSKYADLDLLLFTDRHDAYLDDRTWMGHFGELLVCIEGRTAGNDPELLALYKGFQGIDFVFVPTAGLNDLENLAELPEIFSRGYSIWLDKDEVAEGMPPRRNLPYREMPDEVDFQNTINSFLYGAYYVARVLFQQDLWLAKSREGDLRHALLRMIEWHARATHDWTWDVWHMGKYMQDWADPRVVESVPELYTGYSMKESQEGLLKTLNLFETLARETSELGGFGFPNATFEEIRRFVFLTMEN